MFQRITEFVKMIANAVGMYLVWIVLHYISAQLYAEFCTPKTIQGFLLSPFYAISPQCKSLRWIIYNSGSSIEAMWFIAASFVLSRLIPVRAEEK